MPEKEKKDKPKGLKLNPSLWELLAKMQEIELEDFEMNVSDLEIWLQPGAVATPMTTIPRPVAPVKGKPLSILDADFIPPVETYPGKIVEVKLGARKGEG